ncbi:MAG TPA: hypothetical protein VK837_01620 [Longimicrobiales bacterium]|nr:hypothetical protein [Longimicrobiales bacterium]
MDLPDGERRYSDKEVSRILERATQLQATARSGPAREGLTLRELQEIGVEAGIDAATLRAAARELDAPVGSGLGNALAGGPLVVALEARVAGSLPRESLDALVPLIQRAADAPGQASAVGDTLTWSSNAHGNTRSLQVLVSAESDDHTLVRVEERLAGTAWALYGGIVGGAGGGIGFGVGGALGGALGSVLLGVLIPVAAFGGSYLLARSLYRGAVARRTRALGALVEDIAREISERSGPATTTLPSDREQKQLTLPADPPSMPDGPRPVDS